MTLRRFLAARLCEHLIRRVVLRRDPDVVIGRPNDAYLKRWWIIPRNPVFNIYLHKFLRSDDDRALHDHPWINLSFLLFGTYTEHTIRAGGINIKTIRQQGDLKLRGPRAAHRIELTHGTCWTLFITGPRIRKWGFHCADTGWRHWKNFDKEGCNP